MVINDFLPINPAVGRPGIKIKPESITIHWVGPFPGQTCSIVRDYWERGHYAAAHYIVRNEAVMCCVPPDEMAYHSGTTKGNRTSIGIEVVPMDRTGKFSVSSIVTLRGLVAELRLKYGELPLLRHYDWSGKACPLYYLDDSAWRALKKEIDL